ncbi:MAG TPA: hypothetical protein VII13_15445, partial [Vicinamibacteria bacterium]
ERARSRQLGNAAAGLLDRAANHSATLALMRGGAARLRFGRDVPRGAVRQQNAFVRALALEPDSPRVRRAQEATQRELDALFRVARQAGVPACLVLGPYLFQLEDPAVRDAPQRWLTARAEAGGVPVLDLLPVLAQRQRADGRTGQDYFADDDHFSELGSLVVADALAEFVVARALLPPARP